MSEVRPILFNSGADTLVGLLHVAKRAESVDGVLIVVGGPQYRVGAHRQYVHLARALADAGIHAMRFDYAGVGDSEGGFSGFEHVGQDVRSAIDEMRNQLPGLEKLYVWGLCDGASVALLHAANCEGVSGLILVNPWVWSEQAADRTMARHYYGTRILDAGFWRALVNGKINLAAAIGGFFTTIGRALRPRKKVIEGNGPENYQGRMAAALKIFPGRIMLILSGNDLVARDFEDRMGRDPAWRQAAASATLTTHRLAQADHTLSQIVWKRRAARLTAEWIKGDRNKGGDNRMAGDQ